jgi:hypothetical protein
MVPFDTKGHHPFAADIPDLIRRARLTQPVKKISKRLSTEDPSVWKVGILWKSIDCGKSVLIGQLSEQ